MLKEKNSLDCGFVDILAFKPSMPEIIKRVKIMDRVISIQAWKIIFALLDRIKSQKEISDWARKIISETKE